MADVSQAVIDAFEGVSSDVDDVYRAAMDRTLSGWRTQQAALVGGSGGLAMILPGAHLLAMAADVALLMNRMQVSTYGVGTILTKDRSALEAEDFANVLAHWSGALSLGDDVRTAVLSKLAADAGLLLGGQLGAKLVGKAVAGAGAVLVGKKLGPKVGVKVAAKFTAKLAGKAGAGFIPFLGAAASAAINVWFITSVCDSAEAYYRFKLSFAALR